MINIKITGEVFYIFCNKSLKSSVSYRLKARLSLDQPHYRWSVCTHASTFLDSRMYVHTHLLSPGVLFCELFFFFSYLETQAFAGTCLL